MSKRVEITFDKTHPGVPDEKIEEAINDLRKRLENFERGGVSAQMHTVEVTEDIDDSELEFS